ncbi:unnamed protein product, partial [Mesorhabditis belari]|uniref:Uncharacterized protein n=1 Tax=Mesorhabditis belari TaxID=2138241 RepID=A0AAF3FKW5_9BILA
MSYEYPSTYLTIGHTIGALGTLSTVFALFVIVKASTKFMTRYKYCLLIMQCSSAAYDLFVQLAVPEIYLPAIACRLLIPIGHISKMKPMHGSAMHPPFYQSQFSPYLP